MADGASFELSIEARSVGVDTSAEQLNSLADRLDAAAAVSTNFDNAIERTRQLLTDAAAASTAAADAVAAGESKFKQLERAATNAAKEVDKVGKAGKDTTELQAKAAAAAAAVQAEATALDKLRAASKSASDEQKRLEGTLKSLESAANQSAKSVANGGVSVDALMKSGKAALGPMGGLFEKAELLKGAFAGGGWQAILAGGAVAAVAALAAAFVALGVGLVKAYFGLAKLAVTTNVKAMKALDEIAKKAEKDFSKLFSGVRVDTFIAAYKDVASLLDESSSAAQGVKAILSTMLNPLFDSAATIGPIVKEFLRGIVLGALLAAIAAVRLRNAIAEVIPEGIFANVDLLSSALDAGKYAFFAVIAVVGLLTVAFGALLVVLALVVIAGMLPVIMLVALAAAFAFLAYVIYDSISSGLAIIADFASSAADYLGSLAEAAYEAGANIIQGLLDSIASGTGMVLAALQNLGAGAMNALKSALGIASPSKFALEFGQNVTGTFADTVESGADETNAALESMAEPPDMPSNLSSQAASGRQAASSQSTSSVSITGPFNFYGVQGAEDAESRFEAMLTRALEGDVLALGGEVPA